MPKTFKRRLLSSLKLITDLMNGKRPRTYAIWYPLSYLSYLSIISLYPKTTWRSSNMGFRVKELCHLLISRTSFPFSSTRAVCALGQEFKYQNISTMGSKVNERAQQIRFPLANYCRLCFNGGSSKTPSRLFLLHMTVFISKGILK